MPVSSYMLNERVCGTAAKALLDRGWGKPKVYVFKEEKHGYIAALEAENERPSYSLSVYLHRSSIEKTVFLC